MTAPTPSRGTATWLAVAACVIVFVGGLAIVVGSGDEPTMPVDDSDASSPSIPLSTTAPQSIETFGMGEATIGETVTFDDGGVARVNGVRRDAPARNALDGPLPDGATSTEIEVEHCIGGDGYEPDLQWQPPKNWFIAEWWTGILDDGTEIEARAGYYMLLEAKPGACSRGYVTIPTPSGSNVAAVTLSLGTGADDEPIGRWNLTRSRPIEAPLQPATPPDAAELGEPVTPAIFGIYDAAVLEVIDNATPRPSGEDLTVEPPDVGRKLVEIRAEVCTDPQAPAPAPGTVWSWPGELRWLIQTSDNYVGNGGGEATNGWDPAGDSFPGWSSSLIVDGDIARVVPANGECVEGYVQIDLPEGAVPAYAIITAGDGHFREIGRIELRDLGSVPVEPAPAQADEGPDATGEPAPSTTEPPWWGDGNLADIAAEELRPLDELSAGDIVIPTAPDEWYLDGITINPSTDQQIFGVWGGPSDMLEFYVVPMCSDDELSCMVRASNGYGVTPPQSDDVIIAGISWGYTSPFNPEIPDPGSAAAVVGDYIVAIADTWYASEIPLLEDPTVLEFIEGLRVGAVVDLPESVEVIEP